MTVEDPHRVPPSRQQVDHQPARNPDGYRVVRDGAAQRPAPGIRTSSWSAKCATSRPSRRRCSPPRPATSCSSTLPTWTPREHQPYRRGVPAAPAAAGPPAARQHPQGRRLAAPHAALERPGRVAAVEVMTATPFIRDCILDKDKTHSILGAIAAGTSQYGMQTFDQSIFGHYKKGVISYRTRCATRPTRTSSSSRSRASRPRREWPATRCRASRRTPRSHASAGSGFSRILHYFRPGAFAGPSAVLLAAGSHARPIRAARQRTTGVDAYVLALGWLARRELTEKQIRQRLARRGCRRTPWTTPSRA